MAPDAGRDQADRMTRRRLLASSMLALGAWPREVRSQAAEVRWDMASLERVVRPMRHDPGGRLPLFLWNLPLPRDSALVEWRRDGRLATAIQALAARGIVPTVEMGWEWTPEGAMAMARGLQEAGRPVYLLIPQADLVERGAYRDTTVWGEGPDASRRGAWRRWPCLPLADPRPAAEQVRQLLRPYADAGIPISGVWFDDEALPHPWNGVLEAQRGAPACRAHYPPGVLEGWRPFLRHAYELRTRLLSEALADPVHALFPGARVGNWAEAASSEAVPLVDERGNAYPALPWGRLDVVMPAAYANTANLPRHFAPHEPVTPERAGRVHLFLMLRTVSTANANKPPGVLSLPFVSRLVVDDPDPRVRVGLSPAWYRELLRHLLLRGSDGLYLFNLGYPGSPVTPAESFESVEDARAVYDELLAHREFLDRGRPMTHETPPLGSTGVLWSGLRLPDRCLVRTVSLGTASHTVTLEPFPGVRVTLDAPPGGATYLCHRDGTVKRDG
jgi:hypothetical protein